MNLSKSDSRRGPAGKDALYAEPLSKISGFRFDRAVVDVFPDMIKRSVPGYEAIISMIGELAARYAQPGSHVYDLGCSLGAALLSMRHQITLQNAVLVGVDNAAAMIEQCQRIIQADRHQLPVQLQCADVEAVDIRQASVVVLNFTLQFVPMPQRNALIKKIHDGLLPGGVLIISEKICFDDQAHQQLMTALHENFKRANGYSELEIAQKRTALENVLVPETLDAHRARFKQAGFASCDVWFQCLNFASLLAIK